MSKWFLLFALLCFSAHSQGTFVYDQQSSTDETPLPGSGGSIQQIANPWGQSFTPSLSLIDFIRLKFSDYDISNGLGATVYVNLRTNSISGGIQSSTAPIFMPNGFAGTTSFFFSNPLPIVPGTVYYFEPVVLSGDQWNIEVGEYNYPGGTVFANGSPVGGMSDVWFREGVLVPEPSSVLLVLVGSGLFVWGRKKGHSK